MSKYQAVREALRAHPEMDTKGIIEILKRQGYVVVPGLVNNMRQNKPKVKSLVRSEHINEGLKVSNLELAKVANELSDKRLQVAHLISHSGYNCHCRKRSCATCRLHTLLCRIAKADLEVLQIFYWNL